MFATLPDHLDLIGKPFERGARGPDAFDCWGLVLEMYRRAGVNAPDFASPGTVEAIAHLIEGQVGEWHRVDPRTPGAVLLFRVDGVGAHVGLSLGSDKFLHCIEPVGVCRERRSLKPWDENFIAAYTYA